MGISKKDAKLTIGQFVSKTQQRAGENRPDTRRGKAGEAIVRLLGEGGSWRNTLFGLVFLGVLARLILFTGFSQATLNLFNVVFIYAIAATGIAFLYSFGGLLSLAHGGLWGIGAYFAAVLAENHHWSVWPVILVAMPSCAILAALLASLSARVEGSYFIIILFAVTQIIFGVMNNWNAVTAGAEGIVLSVHPSIFGVVLDTNLHWYYVTAISLILTLVVVQAAKMSRLGQRMKAIRDNRALAESVGIDIVKTHMVAFALTGAIAALSGVYWAYFEGYVVPTQFQQSASIEFVVVILLGGSAYLLGPTAGSLVVIFLPTWLHLSPLLGDVMIGVVFIAVILISPQGIVGFFEMLFHRGLSLLTHERIEDPEAIDTELATQAMSDEVTQS